MLKIFKKIKTAIIHACGGYTEEEHNVMVVKQYAGHFETLTSACLVDPESAVYVNNEYVRTDLIRKLAEMLREKDYVTFSSKTVDHPWGYSRMGPCIEWRASINVAKKENPRIFINSGGCL